MSKTTRKRISVALAVVCCLSLIVGSFAFFTDHETHEASAAAGNIDLVFTDVSAAGTHNVDSQTNAQDEVWTNGIASAIVNPGDTFDMSYTLENEGTKSIDVRQQLTVTVTDKNDDAMNLTENAEDGTVENDYQYFLTFAAELGAIVDESKAAQGILVYTLPDIILNGSAEDESAEGGVATQDYDVFLTFERLAKNAFMDSNVTVKLDIQAKQHRNTTDADFVEWASYTTAYESV